MIDAIGPLYAGIARDIRQQITSGALNVGDPLPSTSELTRRYGVSATVARKAVEVLRNEGVVRGQPGKAVYVVARPEDAAAERATVEDLARQVAELRAEVRELRERIKTNRGDDR